MKVPLEQVPPSLLLRLHIAFKLVFSLSGTGPSRLITQTGIVGLT